MVDNPFKWHIAIDDLTKLQTSKRDALKQTNEILQEWKWMYLCGEISKHIYEYIIKYWKEVQSHIENYKVLSY